MPIVDSHCHVSESWYEAVEVLLRQMDANGVEHAVLVQMQGQTNNTYQADCLRRYPGRFSSVASVDTNRPDAAHALERVADEGHAGVRFRPDTRSPGPDPLLLWRTAERLRLRVSCGGTSRLFASDDFAEVLAGVPQLPIVIEHLGGLNRPSDDDADGSLRRRVFALARFPNAYMKIHGLGEFAERAMPVAEPFPFVRPIPPLLDLACEAFGASRVMWGSDYPPVSGREGYRNALQLPMAELSARSRSERDDIFGGTALRIFPLHG